VFFGGIIPACLDAGYTVQAVYQVDHKYTYSDRSHELLNSLWEAGVRNYPVISDNHDYYYNTVEEANLAFNENDKLTAFQTEQIRRFQPLVIIGHAEEGESHHPAHIVNTACLKQAVEAAADVSRFPESAEQYGTWDTPKLYLHLYGNENNRTVLDFETPLESYGGRTAFEVALAAFEQCESQYTKGKYQVFSFGTYGDCHSYGLYRSLVGDDEARNSLFEHLNPADFREN